MPGLLPPAPFNNPSWHHSSTQPSSASYGQQHHQTPASSWKITWHRHDLSQSQGCSALGSKKGVHPTASVQTLTPHTNSESHG